MNWQPIETAPKDGTTILVCDAAKQISLVNWEYVTGYENTNIGPDGWRSDACRDFGGFEDPTHWMPLPEPPR